MAAVSTGCLRVWQVVRQRRGGPLAQPRVVALVFEADGVAVTSWLEEPRSVAVWPGGVDEARQVHEAGGHDETTTFELVADLGGRDVVNDRAVDVLQADVEGWGAAQVRAAGLDLAAAVAAMLGGSLRA